MSIVLSAKPANLATTIRRLVPFEFGSFGPLHIRHEVVRLGLPRPVHILYASDLHLGHWWTKRVPDRLLAAARQAAPEVILLGGDLLDSRDALDGLHSLIRDLIAVAPVWAIPGNHDECIGIDCLETLVESAGGHWLLRQSIDHPIRIDGQLDPTPSSRPRLLCAHYPSIFPDAEAAGYRLVLAGHLHGGQCVLANRGGQLYPAVWFQRWHGLRFANRAATMLVSRGVADTLPLRFNCPREVLLCEVR